VNDLVDDPGSASPMFLPHILPVDQTLHWANPAGAMDGHNMDPMPYTGPVPIVTHLHGAHVPSNSDGYPEAWYLPAASDIPEGTAVRGSYYDSVHPAPAGAAVFEYPNDQRAMTLWYHDHSLGLTRLNVYAGLAGFWILRDDFEDSLDLPGPAPRLGDAPDTRYYEIPIVIQDRSFNTDGSLFYPDSRAFFDEYAGPYVPETQVPPIWNPEFFGNTIVVNGRTWPYLEVEPRLYRFRLLNGANSRFLILEFDQELSFHQIGNEGGLLPGQPLVLDELLLAPAERADVLVDFSAFKPGDAITLLNGGPDSPFGGLPVAADELSNPETTGQVMQFRVVDRTDQGNAGTIPTTLPPIEALATTLPARDVTLNEKMYEAADIPIEAQLGTVAEGPLDWDDDITENPLVGTTEVWRITNLTEDAHPIHLHLVHFQVLDRIPFDREAYMEAQAEYLAQGGTPPDPLSFATGAPVAPYPWEAGWKDTVVANPDMVTRIIATFDLSGLYVWHCHILEHEDNEMMRPYFVRPQ
jgi:FtsP/CotA-like multicopper oxidase with cupredoxin domain